MSLLLTGIAELTTNDPARGDGHADRGDALLGVVRDAALVGSTDGLVEWVGPADEAPDADTRATSAAAPSSPVSSTRTRTSSSRATAPPSSPRG